MFELVYNQLQQTPFLVYPSNGRRELLTHFNFLFHSFGRWRNLEHFVDGVVAEFAHTPVPARSVRAFAFAIPFWEPAVGILLVFGLWTRWALAAGALLLAALVFGTSLRGDYNVLSQQLIYTFLIFLRLAAIPRPERSLRAGWLASSLLAFGWVFRFGWKISFGEP